MKKCNCDLRTRVLGDGCSVCNPEQALEYARDTIEDLQKERDELAAQVEVMRDALQSVIPFVGYQAHIPHIVETCEAALSITPSAALLNTMRNEEERLDNELLELARQVQRLMDRRDAIVLCRKALEKELVK